MNELAAGAVASARRGWFVFPCATRGKVPITKHGLKDASRDIGLVRAWWDESPRANIGAACGPSGLFVVDLDGPEAARSWRELVSRHGDDGRTLVARTGKGFHLYFAGEGRSSAGRVAPHVDTRGEGGYVIVPPSVHGTGAAYRWVDARVPIARVPMWLLEALDRGLPEASIGEARALPGGMSFTRYGLTALTAIAREMRATPEGERNSTLNALAYRCGRLSAAGQLARDPAERELVAAALHAGLESEEAEATFASGFDAGLLRPVSLERPA